MRVAQLRWWWWTVVAALVIASGCSAAGGAEEDAARDAGGRAAQDAPQSVVFDTRRRGEDSAAPGDAAEGDAEEDSATPGDVAQDTPEADSAPRDAERDTARRDVEARDAPAPTTEVTLVDGALRVNGEPFPIRGVCWHPVPRGQVNAPEYGRYVEQDAALMAAAGINVVRTFGPLTDRATLDRLHAAGIYVLNTVYIWGGEDVSGLGARLRGVADHPAILMWLLGNEWNYNGLYVGLTLEESRDRLAEVAAIVREAAPGRPIGTVYGEVPSPELVEATPWVDVWGLNVYRGLSFGSLFTEWAAVSDKPMFVSEYGADAWDSRVNRVDVASQAEAVEALTREIMASDVALGGTLFEWSDEWWKDEGGDPWVQDSGGIAPGGGPHPDATFNEEWWGVVDIDRNTRPAYTRLQRLYRP